MLFFYLFLLPLKILKSKNFFTQKSFLYQSKSQLHLQRDQYDIFVEFFYLSFFCRFHVLILRTYDILIVFHERLRMLKETLFLDKDLIQIPFHEYESFFEEFRFLLIL